MGPGRVRTRDPWICSQTPYRQCYTAQVLRCPCKFKTKCLQPTKSLTEHFHTGWAATENVNTIDKKSLETEYSIAICHPTGEEWQSKTLFIAIFDPHSLIVKSVFDCHLSGVILASAFEALAEVCNKTYNYGNIPD